MENNWIQSDLENETKFFKDMEACKAKGSAEFDFYSAAIFAKLSAKSDDLSPIRDKSGELKYSIQQGIKAACHTREDVTSILVIQLSLLKRLNNIKNLMWVCICGIAYICYRVS